MRDPCFSCLIFDCCIRIWCKARSRARCLMLFRMFELICHYIRYCLCVLILVVEVWSETAGFLIMQLFTTLAGLSYNTFVFGRSKSRRYVIRLIWDDADWVFIGVILLYYCGLLIWFSRQICCLCVGAACTLYFEPFRCCCVNRAYVLASCCRCNPSYCYCI